MAAAGVDGSNTGARGGLLLLPHDPDLVCEQLHAALTPAPWRARSASCSATPRGGRGGWGRSTSRSARTGSTSSTTCAVAVDADGRDLSVTARALADEIAAAADLVKGKVLGVPAASCGAGRRRRRRDPDGEADGGSSATPGARDLVRAGRDDWFGHGRVEAVRAALGARPAARSPSRSASRRWVRRPGPRPSPRRAARPGRRRRGQRRRRRHVRDARGRLTLRTGPARRAPAGRAVVRRSRG